MSPQASNELPTFRLGLSGLPNDQAFEAWRQIMSRMFLIEPSNAANGLPRGEMSTVLLGDIMANRSFFTTQRLSRDDRQIGSTADHLLLQLYRSGGYSGEIGGRPTRIARGQIAICDLRRSVNVQAQTSDTIGLTIPRDRLNGINFAFLPTRLDPARERLLAARMTVLHLRLSTLAMTEAARATTDFLGGLYRLLDRSTAADVLDARELDDDIVTLADHVIGRALGSPHLSPASIAETLQVSRATLFRAFAPIGGVSKRMWDLRLQAVRVALDQPAERRTLSRLGADLGFKSLAHLSRSFRARYGVIPREWRTQRYADSSADWRGELGRLNDCWRTLGQ